MNELKTIATSGPSTPPGPTASDVPFEHRVFKKPEMAAYFGVQGRTIEHWMKNGTLPFIKMGRNVRFRGSDILATLDALRQRPNRRQGR